MYRFVDTLHSFIHPKEAAKNEKERRKKNKKAHTGTNKAQRHAHARSTQLYRHKLNADNKNQMRNEEKLRARRER